MKRKTNQLWALTLFVAALFFTLPMKAQVTVGNQTAPHSFSVLELTTSKIKAGLRLPQLTNAERDALSVASDPDAKGLIIYNTEAKCLQYWNGSKWVNLKF
jgi:hypothetical protein